VAEPAIPKLTPFEFEKITVPEVAVCVPAWIAEAPPVLTLPVIASPEVPKLTPFEFEKVTGSPLSMS
jgi:hypothetical protein